MKQYYEILKSCKSIRHFRVKYEEEYQKNSATIPQGNVLGPIMLEKYIRSHEQTTHVHRCSY